ncbi:flotillin-2 [Leptonychotes weddellii]|uniref:Flotillin n=5 Tax=Pinnipedia TaxID=3072905 RepID=A0A2U3YBI7_LEPWE|nr:flotillin-2 [Leptonychotes weddellii]
MAVAGRRGVFPGPSPLKGRSPGACVPPGGEERGQPREGIPAFWQQAEQTGLSSEAPPTREGQAPGIEETDGELTVAPTPEQPERGVHFVTTAPTLKLLNHHPLLEEFLQEGLEGGEEGMRPALPFQPDPPTPFTPSPLPRLANQDSRPVFTSPTPAMAAAPTQPQARERPWSLESEPPVLRITAPLPPVPSPGPGQRPSTTPPSRAWTPTQEGPGDMGRPWAPEVRSQTPGLGTEGAVMTSTASGDDEETTITTVQPPGPCSWNFSGPEGSLDSPTAPSSPTDAGLDCFYYITVYPGYGVEIKCGAAFCSLDFWQGSLHTVQALEAEGAAHGLLCSPGGCCGSDYKQYVFGGWAWAWWCISDTQRISLEIMTLQPRCEDVETAEGVALTVTGVAQVKIMTEKELLAVACEQFLGKNVQDIKNVVLQTLEGHLRSILGTLTVEQIYQDRDQFAKLVREVAAPDVGRMGIEILSFTIKDVYDKVDYLSSLGKTQTAVVQRDADIGVAEAERDAGIREAECKKEMLDVKFMADTKIADSKRAFELQKSAFSEEVNIKTAEAQLAYELQGAREQQKIRQEEIEIEVVQRKKQIAVEAQEILRTDKELIATVRRPAEAEAHRIQQIAEGEKVKQVLLAQAEAEKIRKLGEAEAAVIEAMGTAEAERMKLKAEAYQKYGDAAKMALVLEALPQIAAKIAAPLTKVDEIVVLSGDNSKVTSEVNRLLAELPASVHALTGVDLAKIPLIKKATGAQA